MAIRTHLQIKSLLANSSSPKAIPNPSSCFLSLSSNNGNLTGAIALPRLTFRCSSGHGDYQYQRSLHPRPPVIPWSKDLANSVNLIGIIGAPVQIKQLSSGKVLAWTRLGFKKSSSETSWINLTFWDELAHIAFQHVEKGNQLHVCGRLVSDTTDGENEKRVVFYKVVVQQLNFIERSFAPVSLFEEGVKYENYAGNGSRSASIEELWQAFFANPVDWWDNRKNKRNPKYPDFKHKHTGESLWVESKNNPSWVSTQLALLDERMACLQANEEHSVASLLNVSDFLSA
ncbi:Protein OSB1, mitochondrial [Apostasia shenzhenica]|uniref:Protein OSB1, mitochondrial n=1 Tax=Apostasia shenzhenica TaxID=1088818 RepID=A0A2I0BCP8_9ASPA|nr:Protein OSB1, mitochondrial [Apostasia shenzhenica]